MRTTFLVLLLIGVCFAFWGAVGFAIARTVAWVTAPAAEVAKTPVSAKPAVLRRAKERG